MKVINIHKRIINQPKQDVVEVLTTLSKENDRFWPTEKWPAMRFKEGIKNGAKGGHGLIRYTVETYNPNELIQFRFAKPLGFHGIHKLEIRELANIQTEIKHTIDMDTKGRGTFIWVLAIRALHNALIEDGFDKLENGFSKTKKNTKWSMWVKILRKQLERKRSKK